MKNATDYPTNTAIALLLAGDTGTGKCHAKGTPIICYDGTLVPVEDLQEGDLLMGDDSKPRRITKLVRGHGQLYRITPLRGGDPFTVNANHVLVLQTTPKTKGTPRKIVEMSLSEYRAKSARQKHLLKLVRSGPVTFEKQPAPPIDPYFLGIWLGDGASAKPSITTPDEEVITYLFKIAGQYGLKVKQYVQGTNKACAYDITSDVTCKRNPLRRKMLNMGLLGNKHIPATYLYGSLETRKALLAGLLDSDGHYAMGYYEITQVREQLAHQIAYLARSLGFSASIKAKRGQIASRGFDGNYWRVNIVGINKADLPMRIARKLAGVRKINKDWHVSGFHVVELGAGDYYGFDVDCNHRYLLGDFTITHNSTHLFNWPRPWIEDLEGNLKGAIEHHKKAGTLPAQWWWDKPDVDAAGKAVDLSRQFDNVKAQVQAALANPEVATVCVDGFGKLCDLLKEKLVNEPNAAEKSLIIGGMKSMTQSLWNPFAAMLKQFMWDARRFNKPFIVTAHLKIDQNELTTVKEQQIDLQGQLQQSFPKLFSDYFQTMTEQVSDKVKYPRGVRYYLRTAPTMRNPSLKTSFVDLPADLEPGDAAFASLLTRVAGGAVK